MHNAIVTHHILRARLEAEAALAILYESGHEHDIDRVEARPKIEALCRVILELDEIVECRCKRGLLKTDLHVPPRPGHEFS